MVMYEAGMLARSKAGHDKAKMYIIKEVDDTYVYLVDGRIRTLVHPKKKKKKHVQIVHCLLYTSPSPRDISGSRMPSSA